MKCIFDLSFIRYNIYAGVSKYAYRILDYIVEINKCNEFILLINTVSEKQIREWYPQFEYITISSGRLKKIPIARTLVLTYKFKKTVNMTKCDVVFCPWGNEITCLKINKKKISVIHDLQLRIDLKGMNLLFHKIIDDYVIKNSDKIITISEFSKKQIFSFYPKLPEDFIISLGNSVSISNYKGNRPINQKYILYVGRICKMKNIITLIKAFICISDKVKNLNLIIVGTKNEYWHKCIYPLVHKNNLDKRIIIIENCPEKDLALLYQYAEIFVFPSLREGFGSPPIEAAIECCPVVSTTCDSLKEVLMDKVFTYNRPMDEVELSEKIMYVLSHKPSITELKYIRQSYLNMYSIHVFGKKIYDFIKSQS